MKLTIRPLTLDLWPAFEDLFGEQGARGGCWCTYWHAAKRAKAPALEAYPLDARETPSASGTGFASTFARASFKTVARRVRPRPIVRHDLKSIGRSSR
jgi:hypothetical protein